MDALTALILDVRNGDLIEGHACADRPAYACGGRPSRCGRSNHSGHRTKAWKIDWDDWWNVENAARRGTRASAPERESLPYAKPRRGLRNATGRRVCLQAICGASTAALYRGDLDAAQAHASQAQALKSVMVWRRRHKIPQTTTRRREVEWVWWGMPKPLPRVPHVESPFVLRAELLTVVPHSMATIDRLEAEGQFPKRIRLEPTNRVAWLRREVTGIFAPPR